MPRTADYTIKGFLYQFNKSLLEILNADGASEITLEGIVDDIEVSGPLGFTAIQCKYHEAQDRFSPSAIYEPLLQAMKHFCDNPQEQIAYRIYAHFPDKSCDAPRPVDRTLLKDVLESRNKDLAQYTEDLRDRVNLDEFASRCSLEFGPCYDELVNQVHTALESAGLPHDDVDTLAYPNAIQLIAGLSAKHDIQERKITRSGLLDHLKSVRKTAITRWTLALGTREKILRARRKQLGPNLGINSRLRYLVVNSLSFDDFDNGIVMFIADFVAKYHWKPAHIKTPLVCLDTTDEKFRDIQWRLYQKGVVSADGIVGGVFDEKRFFREPICTRASSVARREFAIRLLRWEKHGKYLNTQKCDDLFILGDNRYEGLDTQDVNVEVLAAGSLQEIRFVMGVDAVCG
jgi:hypothetical protein